MGKNIVLVLNAILYNRGSEALARGLVRLMSLLGVLEVFLAGFDGFSEDEDNYMPGYFGSFASARCGDNRRIAAQLRALEDAVDIRYLTPSRYKEA